MYYTKTDELGLISRGNVHFDKTERTIFSELCIAIHTENLEVLDSFFQENIGGKKVDINCKNGYKSTPLCIAAEKNNLGAAKILIKYGADLTIPNGEGKTPIYLFTKHGNEEAVTFLINKYLDSKAKTYELSPSFYETLHNTIEDIKTEDDLNIKNEKVQNFIHEFNIQIQNLHSLLELSGNDSPHWDTI